MNDIFKDMQAKVGCEYISDLPSYKRKVWHEMKRLTSLIFFHSLLNLLHLLPFINEKFRYFLSITS